MAERRVGMGAWTNSGLPIIFVVTTAASSKIMGARPTVICLTPMASLQRFSESKECDAGVGSSHEITILTDGCCYVDG